MSIVSSTLVKDRDHGFARMIEEAHTDSVGNVHILRRFVPFGYDATADLSAHAGQIALALAEREVLEAIT